MNHKKKILIARNKIDKLDKKIFDLIKRRTSIVKHMLLLKETKKQIVENEYLSLAIHLRQFQIQVFK